MVTQLSTRIFSARGAEAGFAGEGHTMLILAAGTKITGVAALRIAAEHHALNDVSDVSLLIEGDFVGQDGGRNSAPNGREISCESGHGRWGGREAARRRDCDFERGNGFRL